MHCFTITLTRLSMFLRPDCVANLSLQLKYLPGVLFGQCLTQYLAL